MQQHPQLLALACLPLGLGLAACIPPEAAAASSAASVTLNRGATHEQYGGMVVNQTVSVAGQDFYRYFAAAWRESDMSERFTVAVHEQASARWGSRVRIEYARRVVFQASLPTSRPAIPALGRQAAEAVRQRIVDAEVDRLLFRDADIGADEI